MSKDFTILIAEDDHGHFNLIVRNLHRAGLHNEILRFIDGRQILDFFEEHSQTERDHEVSYLLILDIRMPKIDGFEVLTYLKGHDEFKKIPVIVLTTTENPHDIERCYRLGCSAYMVKPMQYEDFVRQIVTMAHFLSAIQLPSIG